jgi:hypothetical protein
VPGGICTKRCTADAECQAYGATAVCAALSEVPLDLGVEEDVSAPRYCLEGCALGAPSGTTKCQGRAALACRPFAPPAAVRCADAPPACPGGGSCFRGYCRGFACGPRCEGDLDCASGRHCDPGSGLCVKRAVPDAAIGIACDPDAPTTPCRGGSCLVLFDGDGLKVASFCTQSCVLGEACGNGQGACTLPRFVNYAAGDIGYCQATCDCNGDCKVPADGCVQWTDANSPKTFSSAGVCNHLFDAQTPTLSCSGEAGAAGSTSAAGASGSAGSAQ